MNRSLRSLPAATTLAGLVVTALVGPAAPAVAEPIQVTVRGVVEYNQIPAPPLGLVAADEAVTMSFLVDSETWEDSMTAPTRGYPVDRPSFLLDFESTDIGLQDPFPVGIEAYFVIRDNDPAVDGFILTPALTGGVGPPLSQTGSFGAFLCSYSVTYEGTRLPSLDILDALGSYDFAGLSVYNWTLDDGPFNPMGIVFQDMTIARLNAPLEACCFADGSCLDLQPVDCATMSGLAQGVGTDCAGFTCVRPPGRVPATIRLSKRSAGQLRVRWSVTDCEPSADYGLHEGAIGDWYRHASIDCSDELADFSEEIAAGAGNRYYLVVPHGGTLEGSHGLDSAGVERPRGPAGCRPGQGTDCPP